MEKAKLPFELLPRELSERIRRKILKMPQLDIERDGAMVTDCDLRIKGLDGGEVVYSFVIDVFGPKTVELARSTGKTRCRSSRATARSRRAPSWRRSWRAGCNPSERP